MWHNPLANYKDKHNVIKVLKKLSIMEVARKQKQNI